MKKNRAKRGHKSERDHRKAETGEAWPLRDIVVGVSIAKSEDLLVRGMGEEHLREVLRVVCRPLLRHGADLAYGGYFRPFHADSDASQSPEINFTREMLDLIGAEQDEGESGTWIGMLYNYSPWPFCEKITTEDRARWIDTCTFLPVREADAGLAPEECLREAREGVSSPRIAFNKAVVLSAMRRKMVEGMPLPHGGAAGSPEPSSVRTHARIVVGGKVLGSSGIMPGVFEEALTTLEAPKSTPLFVLGGFGGAAAVLADALGSPTDKPLPPEFDRAHYVKPEHGRESSYVLLEQAFEKHDRQKRFPRPEERLRALRDRIRQGRANLKEFLHNGLENHENQRLFDTADAAEAAHYIHLALVRRACQLRES